MDDVVFVGALSKTVVVSLRNLLLTTLMRDPEKVQSHCVRG